MRIDRSTVVVDPAGTGVFEANVSVRGADGKFLPKTNGGGKSTFFPESWSAQRVLDEISAAATQVPAGKAVTVNTKTGVNIRIIKNADGTVKTAYPVIKR